MSDEKQAAGALGSNAWLGPLPEGDVTALSDYVDSRGEQQGLAYSADQMRAYAAEQVAAERERCARIVERINGWTGTREIAAEIRGEI